jgi:hypothetical protein
MPASTTSESRTAVRGLGEIALRVNNLGAMQKFYEEVIGSASLGNVGYVPYLVSQTGRIRFS